MHRYQHISEEGIAIGLPLGKIVCVGRNYADHARELNNPVPEAPLLFMKPATSAVSMAAPLALPEGRGECHHEVELALLIGSRLSSASRAEAAQAIWGYGVGLDLTLRQLQSALKSKGHPWERAKAFDGACPLSPFRRGTLAWDDVLVRLTVNGGVRQEGSSADMLFPVLDLLSRISETFTLEPGDVVLTGTPAGVGPLEVGDKLRCELVGHVMCETEVV